MGNEETSEAAGKSRWAAYFEAHLARGTILEYVADHWNYHRPLYDRISARIPKGGRILEVGCGPAASLAYFSARGYQATGIDNDPEVLEIARQFATRLGVSTRIEAGDAFDLSPHYDRYDCVFSMGVLEHFEPEVTVRLLREQGEVAPAVFFNIPSKHSVGPVDERFYPTWEMRRMVRQAGLRPVETFGYGRLNLRPWHRWLYGLTPPGLYRILEDQFGHAMNQVCVAVRT